MVSTASESVSGPHATRRLLITQLRHGSRTATWTHTQRALEGIDPFEMRLPVDTQMVEVVGTTGAAEHRRREVKGGNSRGVQGRCQTVRRGSIKDGVRTRAVPSLMVSRVLTLSCLRCSRSAR